MSSGNDIIIGHENVLNSLEQAFYNKKFAHAHLFFGEDGIGKSIIAEYLGKIILGGDLNREYIDLTKCDLLKNVKSIGVNQVRELIEEINKKPYEGENKVIIVYNVNKMTEQAQNAFLKTIEEPPNGVFIFLLCESLVNILDTIKSRCQIHKLEPLTLDKVEKYLKKKYNNITQEKLLLALAYSNGIPGKGDKLLSDKNFNKVRDSVVEFLIKVKTMDKVEVLTYEQIFNNNVNDRNDLFQCFLSLLRDVIIYKEVRNKELLINIDKLNEIKQLCGDFSFKQLNDIICIVSTTMNNLQYNLNPLLVFSDMLLKIQEE